MGMIAKLKWAVLTAAVLALGGVGCASMNEPHARTGYRLGWEISRPPLVISGPNVTAVTSSGSTTTGAGLVGIDQQTALTATSGPVESSVVLGRYRGRVGSTVGAECASLQDLCDRLDRIERRVGGNGGGSGGGGPGPALPPLREKMPSAPATDPCP